MATDQKHALVNIPFEEWEELRDKFKGNWPEHILGYSIVNNYIEWRQKAGEKPIRNLQFFSLDGDWKSDGTFLVVDRYQLFLYSLAAAEEGKESRLQIALSLLDWSGGLKVSSFSVRHRPAVVHVVESKRLDREFDSETIFYYLPYQHAERLELRNRDGVVLKPLRDSDAEIANHLWPNRHSGSLFFLRRLIKWNPTVGAFKQLPSGEEDLMGWSFILQAGPMGALQVREEYQNQGIGSLVTVAMAKLLAEKKRDTFGFVGVDNKASQKLYEKVGFREFDRIHWLRTYPINSRESIWTGDKDEDL